MFERRLYFHIDWALLAAILALCGIGVAMIYSTTADPTRTSSHLWVTQAYAIGLGLLAMVVTLTLDYRTFTDKSHFIYIGLVVVLLLTVAWATAQDDLPGRPEAIRRGGSIRACRPGRRPPVGSCSVDSGSRFGR